MADSHSQVNPADIYKAYCDCRKRKKNKRGAKKFEQNALYNVCKLTEEINARKYKLMQSQCFIVKYPTKREVFCANFRDRVVQHFVFNELNPVIEKKLIFDTASCRKNKGTDFAIERLQRFVRSETENYTQNAYFLKMDISGFFMSIDRKLLLDMVRKLIYEEYEGKYTDVLDYLVEIILLTDVTANTVRLCSPKEWDELPARKTLFGNPNGLPIGNICSQLFGNLYLNEIDHTIKGLKVKYERYVDDMIVVSSDREKLELVLKAVRNILPAYNLSLNEKKTFINKTEYGIPFLGVRIFPYYTVLTGQRINRLYMPEVYKADIQLICAGANSRKGMFERYHGYRVCRRWFKSFPDDFRRKVVLSQDNLFLLCGQKKNKQIIPLYSTDFYRYEFEEDGTVKSAIVVEQEDIKKILAEYYQVPASSIMKSQYSYVIMFEEEKIPQAIQDRISSEI